MVRNNPSDKLDLVESLKLYCEKMTTGKASWNGEKRMFIIIIT